MTKNLSLPSGLTFLQEHIFTPDSLGFHGFQWEAESQEYAACTYRLGELQILGRTAKITPKKKGQFVTVWKRINQGPIQPFEETDPIDFCIVFTAPTGPQGVFIFPKGILLEKGVFYSAAKPGKRAIRVYPPWESDLNKQAARTQRWQSAYFSPLSAGDTDSLNRIRGLLIAQ